VLAAAQSDENKLRLRQQTEQAQRLGIFGAPAFVTPDGELFWGNDRLDAALAWAKR
jgi:2-hydroxychromene-2-carboxylate isomerase